MANNGKGKNSDYKRDGYIYVETSDSKKPVKMDIMEGDFCYYCGKWIVSDKAPQYAVIKTRVAPCCCTACKEKTEKYVERDKNYKIVLYAAMFFAALAVFGGALFSENPMVVYPAVTLVGVAMIAFPYPITSFETFSKNPIKKVTMLTRILGGIIACVGLFFLLTLGTF